MKKSICFLINCVCLFTGCQYAVPEVFLIPKGYMGKIVVVLEKNNGAKPKYEQNKRVYNIPNSGILATQFIVNEGFVNREFYYVDSLGERSAIPIFVSEIDAKETNATGIFYAGTAGVIGNSNDSLSVIFQEFIVSDYINLDSFFTKEYKQQVKQKLQQAVGHEIK